MKDFFRKALVIISLFLSASLVAQKSSCLSPKHNSYSSNVSQTFVVNKIPTALSYRIQIADDSGFGTIIKDATSPSVTFSHVFPNLNKTYYWRTKAYVAGDSTDWSVYSVINIFSPKNVASVIMWLSAQNVSLPDNSSVPVWADLTTNAFDASQSNIGLQPKYKASGGVRNKPFIDFTANNSLNTAINNVIIPNDSTLGFVSLNLNKPQGYGALFYLGNSGAFSPKYAGRTAGSSYSDGSFRYLAYDGGLFAFDFKTPNANFKIISGFDNNSEARLFSGGNLAASNNTYKIAVSENATLKVGSNQDATENYNGNVHEFIVLKNTTDTNLYRNIEKFIDCEYIPRANLGGNVYKHNGFCDSSITLNPGVGYSSYAWSTGATSPTITLTKFGTYSVTVTDELGFKHTDEMSYLPNLFFRYPKTLKICANDSLVWDTKIPTTYTVTWSDGKTGAKNAIKLSGKYSYIISDASLCTYKSDTVEITLDNFPTTASLGPDTTFCQFNEIYLKTGAAQAVSYLWSTGSTTSSLSVSSSGQYSLTATNVNGCVAKDVINVVISGVAPTVSFSVTPNICIGTMAQFNATAIAPPSNTIVSGVWDFGDLTTLPNVASPTHLYADTGSYTVKVTATTNIGCSASSTQIVNVYPNPQPNFTVSNLCERDSVLFSGNATTYGYPVTQWGWLFGEPVSGPGFQSYQQNPKHYYANAATYTVSLGVQNNHGCTTVYSNTVAIQASPTTNFTVPTLCEKNAATFTDATVAPTSYSLAAGSWNFGDGTSIVPFLNPSHTYTTTGTYTVTHTMTASNGCNNTYTQTVTVNPRPTAYYSSVNPCVGQTAVFNDTSVINGGSIANRFWNFGTVGYTSALQNLNYVFTSPVTPIIKLVVTSDKGCKDSISKTIQVRATPTAAFAASATSGAPPLNVSFINTSTGAASYNWDFANTQTDTVLNTNTTFTDTGSYKVSLVAITDFGCKDTATQLIDVFYPYVDVAVQSVTSTLKNGYMVLTVVLVNKGTVDVTALDLNIRMNNGTLLKEHWTGFLVKGGALLDTLTTSVYMKDTEYFVCVEATSPNGVKDEAAANNEYCSAVDKSAFAVMQPYPVPAGAYITLPLLIPENAPLEVTVCNTQGQSLGTVYSGTITSGLQQLKFDLSGLPKGFYAFRVVYEDEVVTKSFVVD